MYHAPSPKEDYEDHRPEMYRAIDRALEKFLKRALLVVALALFLAALGVL